MDHEMLKPRVIVLAGLALLILALRVPAAVTAIGGQPVDPGIRALLRRPREEQDRDDRLLSTICTTLRPITENLVKEQQALMATRRPGRSTLQSRTFVSLDRSGSFSGSAGRGC
jgi:hypothetical protein